MKEVFSDVSFLSLKSVEKIEALKDQVKYPIPVQIQQNPDSLKEITVEAIAAGLIKVLAADPSELESVAEFKGLAKDEIQKAYDYYRSLLLLIHPNVETDLSLAGIAKTHAKDYPFAEEILTAVKNIGHSPKSYINLAVLYANESADAANDKRHKDADDWDEKLVKVLHEGLDRNPGNSDILAELGGYHLRHHDLEISYEFFQDSLKNMETGERRKQIEGLMQDMKTQIDQENSVFAAYDQIMLGNEDKALEIIEKFLKAEPGSWEGWYIKGWALRCLERYQEAKDAILQSVSKNPDVGAAYNELAICEKELGNKEMAKEYLSMAVELEEDNVIYLANLSYLYLSEKDFDKARYFLEKARLADSSDAQVMDLMDEYEALSGEKLGPVISEEIHTKAEVEEIEKQEHDAGHHAEEV